MMDKVLEQRIVDRLKCRYVQKNFERTGHPDQRKKRFKLRLYDLFMSPKVRIRRLPTSILNLYQLPPKAVEEEIETPEGTDDSCDVLSEDTDSTEVYIPEIDSDHVTGNTYPTLDIPLKGLHDEVEIETADKLSDIVCSSSPVLGSTLVPQLNEESNVENVLTSPAKKKNAVKPKHVHRDNNSSPSKSKSKSYSTMMKFLKGDKHLQSKLKSTYNKKDSQKKKSPMKNKPKSLAGKVSRDSILQQPLTHDPIKHIALSIGIHDNGVISQVDTTDNKKQFIGISDHDIPTPNSIEVKQTEIVVSDESTYSRLDQGGMLKVLNDQGDGWNKFLSNDSYPCVDTGITSVVFPDDPSSRCSSHLQSQEYHQSSDIHTDAIPNNPNMPLRIESVIWEIINELVQSVVDISSAEAVQQSGVTQHPTVSGIPDDHLVDAQSLSESTTIASETNGNSGIGIHDQHDDVKELLSEMLINISNEDVGDFQDDITSSARRDLCPSSDNNENMVLYPDVTTSNQQNLAKQKRSKHKRRKYKLSMPPKRRAPPQTEANRPRVLLKISIPKDDDGKMIECYDPLATPKRDIIDEEDARVPPKKRRRHKKHLQSPNSTQAPAVACDDVPDGRLSMEFAKHNWFLEKYKLHDDALVLERNDKSVEISNTESAPKMKAKKKRAAPKEPNSDKKKKRNRPNIENNISTSIAPIKIALVNEQQAYNQSFDETSTTVECPETTSLPEHNDIESIEPILDMSSDNQLKILEVVSLAKYVKSDHDASDDGTLEIDISSKELTPDEVLDMKYKLPDVIPAQEGVTSESGVDSKSVIDDQTPLDLSVKSSHSMALDLRISKPQLTSIHPQQCGDIASDTQPPAEAYSCFNILDVRKLNGIDGSITDDSTPETPTPLPAHMHSKPKSTHPHIPSTISENIGLFTAPDKAHTLNSWPVLSQKDSIITEQSNIPNKKMSHSLKEQKRSHSLKERVLSKSRNSILNVKSDYQNEACIKQNIYDDHDVAVSNESSAMIGASLMTNGNSRSRPSSSDSTSTVTSSDTKESNQINRSQSHRSSPFAMGDVVDKKITNGGCAPCTTNYLPPLPALTHTTTSNSLSTNSSQLKGTSTAYPKPKRVRDSSSNKQSSRHKTIKVPSVSNGNSSQTVAPCSLTNVMPGHPQMTFQQHSALLRADQNNVPYYLPPPPPPYPYSAPPTNPSLPLVPPSPPIRTVDKRSSSLAKQPPLQVSSPSKMPLSRGVAVTSSVPGAGPITSAGIIGSKISTSPPGLPSIPPIMSLSERHMISSSGAPISHMLSIPLVGNPVSTNAPAKSVVTHTSHVQNALHTIPQPNLPYKNSVQDIRSPPVVAITHISCEACNNKANFLCSGCKRVAYCSRPCQFQSWKAHKSRCDR